ncbi:ommochrome-binding protein-like [Phthorimaea operculella]|nr:ommochrome-binding protein-like [Phthorimaea operculella]
MLCWATLYFIFGLANAEYKLQKISCGGLIFNHVYFDKDLISCSLGRPTNLMYHKFTNAIYFSHTLQNETEVDFAIMSCHLDKKECTDVKGIPGGYALAYDMGNDDIFMGGHDGIYKYNFLTKKADFFSERGKSIWALFVRRNFYYIEYPTQKLFVYKDDTFVPVAEAMYIEIDQFFVSRFGEIYFANKTALYKVTKPAPKREVIVLNDDLVIRQIAEDNYSDVYFCANDGIYMEQKPAHHLKKLADINQAFGLAFDQHDHVIYSDKDCIFRLIPSNHSDICYNALKTHTEHEEKKKLYVDQ